MATPPLGRRDQEPGHVATPSNVGGFEGHIVKNLTATGRDLDEKVPKINFRIPENDYAYKAVVAKEMGFFTYVRLVLSYYVSFISPPTLFQVPKQNVKDLIGISPENQQKLKNEISKPIQGLQAQWEKLQKSHPKQDEVEAFRTKVQGLGYDVENMFPNEFIPDELKDFHQTALKDINDLHNAVVEKQIGGNPIPGLEKEWKDVQTQIASNPRGVFTLYQKIKEAQAKLPEALKQSLSPQFEALKADIEKKMNALPSDLKSQADEAMPHKSLSKTAEKEEIVLKGQSFKEKYHSFSQELKSKIQTAQKEFSQQDQRIRDLESKEQALIKEKSELPDKRKELQGAVHKNFEETQTGVEDSWKLTNETFQKQIDETNALIQSSKAEVARLEKALIFRDEKGIRKAQEELARAQEILPMLLATKDANFASMREKTAIAKETATSNFIFQFDALGHREKAIPTELENTVKDIKAAKQKLETASEELKRLQKLEGDVKASIEEATEKSMNGIFNDLFRATYYQKALDAFETSNETPSDFLVRYYNQQQAGLPDNFETIMVEVTGLAQPIKPELKNAANAIAQKVAVFGQSEKKVAHDR